MIRVILILAAVLAVVALFSVLLKKRGARGADPKYLRALAVLVLVVVLGVLPMLVISQITSVAGIYNYGVDSFVDGLGAPIWLARAVVILLLVPFLWAIKEAFAFSRRRRTVGRAVLAVFLAGYCGVMFFATKDTYFDHKTGKATKYYCQTPEGYRVFDSPGFDPKYGIELKALDATAARVIAKAEAAGGTIPGQAYFDPLTGTPLKWFSRTGTGDWEFHDEPGYHPQTGQTLSPFTREVAAEYGTWLEEQKARTAAQAESDRVAQQEKVDRTAAEEKRQAEAAFRAKYVTLGAGAKPSEKSVGVLVTQTFGVGGKPSGSALAGALEADLRKRGRTPVANPFRARAFTDRILESLYEGAAPDRRLGLGESLDGLLLVEESPEFAQNPQLGSLITCNLKARFRFLDLGTGTSSSGTVEARGIGTTRDMALDKAATKAAVALLEAVPGY